MLQEIMELLPDAANRIHPPIAFAIAGLGLLIGLTGARFSRSIIALSLVSAGTVIGLQMPKWFGWGIDPMGTAFGAAIVLGLSGYILTHTWEGILFATMLALGAGLAVWLNLAPHAVWHLPTIDWSATAIEIAAKVRLSLPSSLVNVLPATLGIGATVGALLMVIAPRLGRVLFYGLLGMGLLVIGGVLGVRQVAPDSLMQLPRDPWVQAAIFGGLVVFSAGVQWLLLPRAAKKTAAPSSDNKLASKRNLATFVAARVQTAEQRVLVKGPESHPAGIRPHKIPSAVK